MVKIAPDCRAVKEHDLDAQVATRRDVDHRDLALEMLAADEAALRARGAELEADCRSYREIALAALDQLVGLTRQLDRARETIARLLAERRAPREEAA